MPEVLERDTTFTSETAREAGLRSAHVAKLKAQELENLRLILSTKPLEKTQSAPQDPPAVEREVQEQINLSNELITHARERIKDDSADYCEHCKRSGIDDKSKAALMREIRGLMEHLCRLHNISQAPQSKPTSKPTATRARPFPEPVPSEPTSLAGGVSIPVQAVDTQHKE